MKEGLRHPVRYVRGEGIPPDHITPWELLLYFFNRGFGSMSGAFTGKQDFLYKEVYRIPPNNISVAGVVSSIWDAVNDPILGSWMDKKRYGPKALRTILRISAITGNLLAVVKLIDGGLSPWGHLALLMFCNMSQDIVGTMAQVAGMKVSAGISPSSQQRGRIAVWSNVGFSFTWFIASAPMLLMGFREVFGFTDYQIIFLGSCIMLPFGIAAAILPSFVRQRVDFAQLEEEEGEKNAPWAQAFRVIKHNKYFILNSIASFITVFSPNMGDELTIYRYIMPTFRVFGKEMGGEGLLMIKQMLAGNLSTVLEPFGRQIINKLGGPLRAQRVNNLLQIGCNAVKFFAGYKSIPRLAVLVLMESLTNASAAWDGVAGSMLGYEFYDYVELKTGERSEGVTTAVNNLFSKIVTNNIGQVTGNAFLQWTGYRGGYQAEGTRPPERYLKTMWPMYCLIPVLDQSIWLAARSLVKWKPEDRERTEFALAERRAAAQKLREELTEEKLIGG